MTSSQAPLQNPHDMSALLFQMTAEGWFGRSLGCDLLSCQAEKVSVMAP
jgi:hypothetical protein